MINHYQEKLNKEQNEKINFAGMVGIAIIWAVSVALLI